MAARRPFWKWRRWKSIGFCLWPPSTCMWNLKLKFHRKLDLCSGNHVVYRQTNGRTDGRTRWIQYTLPPTLLGGGYNHINHGAFRKAGTKINITDMEQFFLFRLIKSKSRSCQYRSKWETVYYMSEFWKGSKTLLLHLVISEHLGSIREHFTPPLPLISNPGKLATHLIPQHRGQKVHHDAVFPWELQAEGPAVTEARCHSCHYKSNPILQNIDKNPILFNLLFLT